MKEPRRFIIRKEPEPLYSSGFRFACYADDGSPCYLARETRQQAESDLRAFENVESVAYEDLSDHGPFLPGDFVRSRLSPVRHCGFIMRKATVSKLEITGYIVRLASGADVWIGESDLELIDR